MESFESALLCKYDVDSTLAPAPHLMWFRTTLIKVHGPWQVAEFAADVGQMSDLECGMARTDISDVLTLAHDQIVDLGALRICKLAPTPEASSGGASSSSSSRRQPRVSSLRPSADLPDVPVLGRTLLRALVFGTLFSPHFGVQRQSLCSKETMLKPCFG